MSREDRHFAARLELIHAQTRPLSMEASCFTDINLGLMEKIRGQLGSPVFSTLLPISVVPSLDVG